MQERGVSSFDVIKMSGFLRLAYVDHVDLDLMVAWVSFNASSIGSRGDKTFPAQFPISYLSSGGGFIGGMVASGTPVVVGQAEGSSSFFIVSFLARDPAAFNTVGASKIKIPLMQDGDLVIQANTDGSISLSDDGITIGEPRNLVSFDTNRKILLNTFDTNYSLSQGSRLVDGTIKRDTRPAINFASFLRSADTSYDDTLKIIGMDPVASARSDNVGDSIRNPARIEKREVIFEFEDLANVQSDDVELEFYKTGTSPNQAGIIDRRAGRADALSLSLTSPNYLIETIKGTVVDLYGNILDINRNIIPIGDKNLSVSQIKSTANETDKFKNIYQQIKREDRKSIVYHFEINAKKETGGSGPPDVNDQTDYARLRSRFFFDIDKEGQFKLNVPASSENGNIPLLTRYENYSTVNPNDKSKNPNDLVFNPDNKDILIESFVNTQIIELKDELKINAAPIDRFSDSGSPTQLKHGSVYHDISSTCITFQGTNFSSTEYVATSGLASGRVSSKPYIVNNQIVVSGPNANAGGRSGSLNFDGSIEINIGANTVDRQSLWLDTQGGAVVNIGKDKNNISFAASMDGEFLMELGNRAVPTDSRFDGQPSSAASAGAFDVRVYNSKGELTILRIDNEGLTISTPSRMVFVSNGDIMMRTNGTMTIDAEVLNIQNRTVNKNGNDI